ncbi:ribonuclease P protein component [Candidatus Gracilibacteria bacterium]|nr:ribonuclease P protein component [Candidatus Gracilibacteria bacterium]
MISKEYRLTENELRKVLNRKKPFFSYVWIANTMQNKIAHGRCAILLSSKCTKGSVNRNYWRRKFYDISLFPLNNLSFDVVLVPKKGTILDYKNNEHIIEFEKNIQFLYRKIQEEYNSKIKK